MKIHKVSERKNKTIEHFLRMYFNLFLVWDSSTWLFSISHEHCHHPFIRNMFVWIYVEENIKELLWCALLSKTTWSNHICPIPKYSIQSSMKFLVYTDDWMIYYFNQFWIFHHSNSHSTHHLKCLEIVLLLKPTALPLAIMDL